MRRMADYFEERCCGRRRSDVARSERDASPRASLQGREVSQRPLQGAVGAIVNKNAWPVCATHDGCKRPSIYAAIFQFFHHVVADAAWPGARIVTVAATRWVLRGSRA